MQAFATIADLEGHLERLGFFRIRPELGLMRSVLSRLDAIGNRKPRFVVQVAGTNGKGSTATFLASLGMAHSLKVGLYTSPHFVSFRERIRFGFTPVSEDVLLEPANRIMALGGEHLTYFEFVTTLAALLFAEAECDIAIMETGMGGTWDAVTALPADTVAFTPIGLDHCQFLGNTIAAIAADKAGAMRPGKPAFSAPQVPEALAALSAAAKANKCPFIEPTGPESLPYPIRNGTVSLGLAGIHQYTNAALALAVWREAANRCGWIETPDEALESRALHEAFIPGRLQYIPPCPEKKHPALLLDGAHNAHGMAALGRALAKDAIAPSAVIFACLNEKDPKIMAAHLRVLSTGPIFVPPIPDNPRALPPEDIAAAIGLAATPAPDMQTALNMATEHIASYMPEEAAKHPERYPTLVCGSLYMLAHFFALRPDCLLPQRLSSS